MIKKNILIFITLLFLLTICFLSTNSIQKGTNNIRGSSTVVIEESNDTIESRFANKIITKKQISLDDYYFATYSNYSDVIKVIRELNSPNYDHCPQLLTEIEEMFKVYIDKYPRNSPLSIFISKTNETILYGYIDVHDNIVLFKSTYINGEWIINEE